jgi:IS1 family transposase
VAKKQEHCDPEDPADVHSGTGGTRWRWTPESRWVLAVVPGARDAETVEEVVGEVQRRTGGRVMDLMTSDDYPAYETAILHAYGHEVATTATGRPSRRMILAKVPPPGLVYATLEKRREKGREVAIVTRVVFGTMAAVLAALGRSRASLSINVSFLERQNGTDRHRNARKVRKAYTFSKDWRVHEAMTNLTMYSGVVARRDWV